MVLAFLLPAGALPARAAEEVVRTLDVTYDVRADGSIGVTHELDWVFGESGRHGIDFGIATAEVWEDDPRLEARYGVSNLTVSSPTGAPTQFEATETSEETTLRIGDPNQALEDLRETYVISYDLTGALRTFDGVPELHWDVTSPDYPPVENYTVTVQAPGDIPQARCLAGSEECQTEVNGSTATLTGSNLSGTLTAVAALPASVANAEPDLQERELSSPLALDHHMTTVIDDQGRAQMELRRTYALPENESSLRIELPTRRKIDWRTDRVYEVSMPEFTTADGQSLPVKAAPETHGSERDTVYTVDIPGGLGETEVIGRWQVSGAVHSSGETAEYAYPNPHQAFDTLHPVPHHFTWQAPAEVSAARCQSRLTDAGPCPEGDPQVEGDQVSWQTDESSSNEWMVLEVPADAVGGATALTERSSDTRGIVTIAAGVVGALIAAIGAGRLGLRLGRVRFGGKDLRYDGVPPGLMGSPEQVTTASAGSTPVRFEPPETSLHEAGFVLDRGYEPRHLAASLVAMAVAGTVRLGSKPLTIERLDGSRLANPLQQSLYRLAPTKSAKVSRSTMRKMGKQVEKRFTAASFDQELFQESPTKGGVNALWQTLVFLIPVAIGALTIWGWMQWDWPIWFIGVAVVLGFLFNSGRSAGEKVKNRPLGPRGSALRDQTLGFREFIRTADAHRLNFEADRDIYTRYLPWAVLFGETKRWTKVCTDLAATGQINLDTTFSRDTGSALAVASDLDRFTARVAASSQPISTSGGGGRSSSGGSGSSSGFSSSGGGSGGGGTSASSW